MPKDRSYANPVVAKLAFIDKDAPIRVEVSEYQVTDKHVILTKKAGDSKITKYVAISALKTFEFDAPIDYAPPKAASPFPALTTVYAGNSTVSNGGPVFEPNPIVARIRPKVERPPAEVPVVKSEDELVKTALTGAGAARMS